MIDLPKPLAVVCHDAGGANQILPWLAASPERDVLPVMAGPAAELWRQRFATVPTLSLDEAVDQAGAVLTATGWASDLEHRARARARSRGLRSVAILDHWVNYRDRFRRGGAEVLPNEIWVTDPFALDLARQEFPNVPIREKPGLYLQEQVAATARLAESDREVLLIAEPAHSDWGRGVPGEFQALDFFMASRRDAGIDQAAPIRLRPHPSDPNGKYDEWIAGQPGVTLDRSDGLSEALGGARWVVGCESYALAVALAAGRQVISSLPPWAPHCRLPQPGIVHLARL